MKSILFFAAGIGFSVLAAHAHHSIAGAYDTSRNVTIEGTVAQFHFVNPHPYLTVDVRNDSGDGSQQWRLEMDNRSELVQIGMTAQTLKPGEKIVASGSPGRREQSPSLYVWKLDRPSDGFRYEQIGMTPRIRIQR
jgi:hypothetical protein